MSDDMYPFDGVEPDDSSRDDQPGSADEAADDSYDLGDRGGDDDWPIESDTIDDGAAEDDDVVAADDPDDRPLDVEGEPEPGEAGGSDDTIDLSVPESEDQGVYGAEQLSTFLDDLAVDATEFDRTMRDLGLDSEPDGRSVVVTLEQLEVPSRLEYADVDRLADLVAEGAEIRLASGHLVVGLDDLADEAVVALDDVHSRVPLDTLEQDWADQAFELVVAEGADGSIVLLPIALDEVARGGGISG